MRILFFMVPEHGHHLPTFGLANALRARGHEVVYASVIDLAPLVEERGFRFVPVHRDMDPRGTLEKQARMSPEERLLAFRNAFRRRAEERLSGVLLERLREIAPDVMLVDTLLPSVAFLAHGLGVPCLRIGITFSARLDGRPPITSPLPLDASPSELEGALTEVARGPGQSVEVRCDVDFGATRAGYPLDRIVFASALAPEADLFPEIVLSAAALDFPHDGPRPMHFPPPVDVGRKEHVPEELVRFVDSARPLIYVALGSQVGRYVGGASTFASIVDAMRAEPEWRAVIAAGDRLSDDPVLRDPPPNVLALKHAPQIWLLARSTVFVTHAGMGSMREAVALRVPVVAVPQGYDQPGNAARIAHHGIGVHLKGDALGPGGVLAALRAIVKDRATYVERLARLDEAYRGEQEDPRPLEAIERAGAANIARPSPTATPERAPDPVQAWIFLDANGRTPEGALLDTTGAWMPGDAAPRRTAPPGDVTQKPLLGVSGYVASRTLGGALGRAAGAVLARVELKGDVVEQDGVVVGRALRCLSSRNVGAALQDYAYWCANTVLEPEARVSADAAHALAALAAYRERWAAGRIATSEESTERARITEQSARHWQRGLLVLRHVLSPSPHEAARLSHWHAINMAARRAAGDRAGTKEGAVRFECERRAAIERAEAELLRRLTDAD